MAKRRASGEGTIIKFMARNCFRASISVPLPTGGTKREYHYGTKAECRDWLTQMREEIRIGKPVLDSKLTLFEWLRMWLNKYCVNIRASTRTNYICYIEKHVANHRIASVKLKNLSTDDIQDFISFLKTAGKLDGSGGLGNKTIRNTIMMLRTALKQAVGNQLIWTNPAEYSQIPKVVQHEKQLLTVEEMAKLMNAAKGERWYIGLVLLLMTGCRLGELLALRHSSLRKEGDVWVLDIHSAVKRNTNFNAKAGERKTILEISEPKSARSDRTIPLLPEVAYLLQAHIQQQKHDADHSYGLYQADPFIVGNEIGELIDPSSFRKWFKGIVEKANIGRSIRIHDCRGSWASAGLKAGIPTQYLSAMLGHSSTQVTEKYYLTLDIEGKNRALQNYSDIARELLG